MQIAELEAILAAKDQEYIELKVKRER